MLQNRATTTIQLLVLIVLLSACGVTDRHTQGSQHVPAVVADVTPSASPQTISPSSPPPLVTPASEPVVRDSSAQNDLRPYPIPPWCTETAWSAIEKRRGYSASWLDGDGIALGSQAGILYEGWQKVQWQTDTSVPSSDLSFSGERTDAHAEPMMVEVAGEVGYGVYSSGVIFPTSGCWRIQATAGDQALDATVYVYPGGCRPDYLRGAPDDPEPCRPPTS